MEAAELDVAMMRALESMFAAAERVVGSRGSQGPVLKFCLGKRVVKLLVGEAEYDACRERYDVIEE